MIKTYTKDEYAKAYVELLQILSHVSQKDFEKIPKQQIDFWKQNQDKSYHYEYDLEVTFEEQEISHLTKIIIANLYIQYWTMEEEKKIIKKEDTEQWLELEKKKRKNDNAYNLFLHNEKNIPENNNETSLVVSKNENIFTKIINKLKEILFKFRFFAKII